MSLASSADLWLTVQAAVSAKDGHTHTSGSVLELDIYFEDFADSLDLLEFTVAYYHSLAYTKSWEAVGVFMTTLKRCTLNLFLLRGNQALLLPSRNCKAVHGLSQARLAERLVHKTLVRLPLQSLLFSEMTGGG